MTNVTWIARDRNVVGLSVDPAANTATISWSADPSLAAQSLPWAIPEYPTLLIYGISVSITTSATVANRRLELLLTQPNGGTTRWQSSGTQAAGLTRRWEVAVGYSLETTLANDTFREPLGRGFMLLPGLVGESAATLVVSIATVQAGDVIGPVTVRGALLYP